MRQCSHVIAALMILCTAIAHGEEFKVPQAPGDPVFTLPAPDGHYPVGVRSYSWIDEARTDTRTTRKGAFREVTVQIWYPAVSGRDEPKALYAPELKEMLEASADLPPGDRAFVRAHAPLLDVATNSVPNAEIARPGRPWQTILFSPGGNVSRHFQTSLAERIASQGFVFVSMSHPYSTIDVGPRSGFSMSIDWGLDDEDEKTAAANDDHLADVLAGDASFVADRLAELAKSGSPFSGALDPEHLGIAGHSRGGTTVGRACASDPRFIACAVLDNIGPEREQKTGVQPPFLTLRSPWDEDRAAVLQDYLGRTGSVAFDVVLEASNHFTCTDLPLFLDDLRVDGVEPASGIGDCARILTGFFESFLAGHPSTLPAWRPPLDRSRITLRSFRRK